MIIHLFIQWYGRHSDMSVNYDEEHHGTISGATPDECMTKFRALSEEHDLARFSPMSILYIF